MPWVPKGCSDAVDATNIFRGAMRSLSNLVPDPENIGVYVPRPASVRQTDFIASGFTNHGFVSCCFVVGDRAYGLIATDDTPGHDMPFIYDLAGQVFVSVSGITGSNVPSSQPTSGPWTPPTMAVIGTKVIVTSNGYVGSSNKFGWFDISTFSSPSWNAGDTATHGLPDVPTAVFNFFDRAYYAVNNTIWFSDVLDPTTISNATNTLTLGDTTNITALGGLPLQNQLGGVVQSLIAFKSKVIFQITGDLALNNLAQNAIIGGIGTTSPLSVTPSHLGLFFMSDHGLRMVTQDGQVSGIIGANGSGISVPFINSIEPTRISAAFNVDTIRITTQNGAISTQPIQEWWYNTDLESWSGPHTFPASIIQPWRSAFILSPVGILSSLWQSDTLPKETSNYIENGNQLEFEYTTPPLPLTQTMNQNAVLEHSVGMSFSEVGGTINFFAFDENGGVLDNCSKTVIVSASIWGSFVWLTDLWGGTINNYQQFRIPWTKPLVFSQIVFSATGQAIPGFRMGNTYLRYQVLGYMVYN
jgi:hypothetical protein